MPTITYRKLITIKGIVQGVGFRPYIFNLAKQNYINGHVKNTQEGVLIDAEGSLKDIEKFILQIKNNAPSASHISELTIIDAKPHGYNIFEILKSENSSSHNVFISPDLSICTHCKNDIDNKDNIRYQYPFTNCTNCGPRFTITKDIPYDRKNTVMKKFKMCNHCSDEYNNPLDRRFHAQPISCSQCGPKLLLLDSNQNIVDTNDILSFVRDTLKKGYIYAIKGIGGYHLVCDAKNQDTIKTLRSRKHRDKKPFALMASNIPVIKKYCFLSPKEEELLRSPKSPIVLLNKKNNYNLPKELSSDNLMLGIMLPYSPLHHLLFKDNIELLVMTSGNVSGEPIAYTDIDALNNLKDIADYFLIHDRDIYIRTDDSVTSSFEETEFIIRRSRGYVPFPIIIPSMDQNTLKVPTILSVGAELKNTFCITKNNYAFLSHHIGDLENYQTLSSFESGIEHFKKIFKVEPDIIACDMHREYLSTKYAIERYSSNKQIYFIQHHHAHIASCMAENGLVNDVIGIAFDGTGYGEDDTIWGGEFFTGKYNNFKREARLSLVAMPGGDACIKEPIRMALSYIYSCFGEKPDTLNLDFLKLIDSQKLNIIIKQIKAKLNSPLTSSIGRLFDAVSALLDLCYKIEYEGQAAILLEKLANKSNTNEEYHFEICSKKEILEIDSILLFKDIVQDLIKKNSKEKIAKKFHNTISSIVLSVCIEIRKKTNLNDVALSGGVFQNKMLLSSIIKYLRQRNFNVYINSIVPTNDGGISYGQSAISFWKFLEKNKSIN